MKAEKLLKVLENLDWGSYIELSDEIIKINKLDIDGELAVGPRIYSYYLGLLTMAKDNSARANLELDQLRAGVRKALVTERKDSGDKITDKIIDAMVDANPEVAKLSRHVNSVIQKENLMKNLVDSLKQRHECLVQLSANNRSETRLTSN